MNKIVLQPDNFKLIDYLNKFELQSTEQPAIQRGAKAHAGVFPGWPVIGQTEEKAMQEVLQNKLK